MFDHIGIVASDLRASARLYAHMLAPLGIEIFEKHRLSADSAWAVFSTGKPQSPFLVIGEGRPSFWSATAHVSSSPVHLCFSAPCAMQSIAFMRQASCRAHVIMVLPAHDADRSIALF